jgi:hypothetical protein
MIDEDKIKKLLATFYNGDTTQEEETLLQEFLNDKNISEKWYEDRDLFHILYDSSGHCIPKGLSERLEHCIDRHIRKTATVNENKTVAVRKKIKRILISTGSIAAAILLFTGIFFFHDKPSVKNNVITDTYTDPKEAAIVAEKILALVSTNLNKGLSPLEKAKESIDKTNELLNESLNLNR